jgi:TrkA domain protein
METTHSTVPGAGVLHDCQTRDGQQFRILVARPGRREIFVYDSADSAEPDRAVARIVLEEDEADQVAELLHSQPITDRIAELERRVARLAGGRG